MRLNINDIYNKNIASKYNAINRNSFEKDFDLKHQNMWMFTLCLLKDNFPKEEYDSVEDLMYLRRYLSIYFVSQDKGKFTIDEWFEYLSSKR